jgi:hypothetical protein
MLHEGAADRGEVGRVEGSEIDALDLGADAAAGGATWSREAGAFRAGLGRTAMASLRDAAARSLSGKWDGSATSSFAVGLGARSAAMPWAS